MKKIERWGSPYTSWWGKTSMRSGRSATPWGSSPTYLPTTRGDYLKPGLLPVYWYSIPVLCSQKTIVNRCRKHTSFCSIFSFCCLILVFETTFRSLKNLSMCEKKSFWCKFIRRTFYKWQNFFASKC